MTRTAGPVWGRVSVGTTPTIAFTGRTFFFSDNAADGSVSKGDVTALVKPGAYSATCYGEGFGFYSYTIGHEHVQPDRHRQHVDGHRTGR